MNVLAPKTNHILSKHFHTNSSQINFVSLLLGSHNAESSGAQLAAQYREQLLGSLGAASALLTLAGGHHAAYGAHNFHTHLRHRDPHHVSAPFSK